MANTELKKKRKGVIVGANGFNNDAGKVLFYYTLVFRKNYVVDRLPSNQRLCDNGLQPIRELHFCDVLRLRVVPNFGERQTSE